MKNKIKVLIFLCFSISAHAQDYAKDIKNILEDFSELKSYSINARISVTGEESYSFDAWVKSSEYGSHIRTDFSEMLVNKNVAIAIDHEDKLIRVQRGDYKEKGRSGNDEFGFEMMEELMGENTRVEFLGNTETYKTYVVYHDGGIEKTIIKINLESNFFHEIEVFFSDQTSSISSYKIQYNLFKENPEFSKEDFEETVVIKKLADGSYSPAANYKGYIIETE